MAGAKGELKLRLGKDVDLHSSSHQKSIFN
jgi:hypothetical protein